MEYDPSFNYTNKFFLNRTPAERVSFLNLPRRFKEQTFDGLEARGVARIELWAMEWSQRKANDKVKGTSERGTGFVLRGPLANRVSVAALRHVVENHRASGFYTDAADLIEAAKDKMRLDWTPNGNDMPFYFDRCRSMWSLLVLADLGSEHESPFTVETINSVIKKRYEECKATIITTHMSTQRLNARYGDGFVERLKEYNVFLDVA